MQLSYKFQLTSTTFLIPCKMHFHPTDYIKMFAHTQQKFKKTKSNYFNHQSIWHNDFSKVALNEYLQNEQIVNDR